ncbi:MAG: alanyl-tRNA editing protein [Burkholderiaceae bacterium]
MLLAPTVRLYLDDDHAFEANARITGVRDNAVAFDRSCFYPGGGGQPADAGSIELDCGAVFEVVSAHADDDVVWHALNAALPADCIGRSAHMRLNHARRVAHTRYHTVLHVLNTIALRDYGGWITGAQIDIDYSRIDFKLDKLSPALCAEIESKVNAVIDADRNLKAYYISEAEFLQREDLLRTLEVKPPVHGGQVRVVEIQGFDAQACGGTHARSTAEVGRFSIFRTENKGKINKRLYVRLS